ncbi:MAG: DUF2786 domain-containing protein [Nitrospinota bacterium]
MNQIPPALKSLWIRQLYKEWELANYHYFEEKMRSPEIDLFSSEKTMGKWEGGRRRRLSLSLHLIQNHNWQHTQEVLYHEMVHQYIEEVLLIADALAHGDLFTRICSLHSIDPRAQGSIETWQKKSRSFAIEDQKTLNRIRKLFSLAQSKNKHEAELAMTKARGLLLKHNLSLMDSVPEYVNRHVGDIGRKNTIQSLVAQILQTFFFVKTIWSFSYDPLKNKSGRVLELFGREENVEMGEYVYFFLINTVESLWKRHKAANGITRNKNRKTYIYGLLHGFHEKLSNNNKALTAHGLVWKEDASLLRYYERKKPKTRKSAIACRSLCTDTYRSGFSRGKSLVLHKGIASRADSGGPLPGKEPKQLA